MSIVLDGKALADRICGDLKGRVDVLRENGINPKLTIVTTGSGLASAVYIKNKMLRCEEIGIQLTIKKIDKLTKWSLYEICEKQPIIFQKPMDTDGSLTAEDFSKCVDAECDVDGFLNFENVSALASGRDPVNYPCTPKGIIRLLDEYKISIEGKRVCIIGRSNIVGRPLARMMENRGVTVTLCHSKTNETDLIAAIGNSTIIVSATGNRDVLKYLSYCPNKILIDVGMNHDESGKLCGDFQKDAYESSYAYTPVPGGVGPMTVAMLMENVVNYYERG